MSDLDILQYMDANGGTAVIYQNRRTLEIENILANINTDWEDNFFAWAHQKTTLQLHVIKQAYLKYVLKENKVTSYQPEINMTDGYSSSRRTSRQCINDICVDWVNNRDRYSNMDEFVLKNFGTDNGVLCRAVSTFKGDLHKALKDGIIHKDNKTRRLIP